MYFNLITTSFELENIDISDEGEIYYSTNGPMGQILEEITQELVGRCQ